MEKIDPQKAARVGQRVQGTAGMDVHLLQEAVLEESITATGWKQLSRNTQGQNKALLEQLQKQTWERCACLRGICRLLTGSMPEMPAVHTLREGNQALLRAGYGQLMRCLARYEAWQTDPEYGPTFAQLVRQTREHCRSVLQLLGSIR